MDTITKVKTQIKINTTVLVVSLLLIFIALCVRNHKLNIDLAMLHGLGSEFIFTMTASLGSVMGWRFVEGIRRNRLYLFLLHLTGAGFCVEYGVGVAMLAEGGALDVRLVLVSAVLFVFFFWREQIAILHNAEEKVPKKEENSLSLRKREEYK